MTPDVRRQFNRTAEHGTATLASAATTLSSLFLGVAVWLREKSEIYEARADVEDEELIPMEEDE